MTTENDGLANFTVFVQEIHTVPIRVRALHRQEAQAKAEELIEAGCYPDDTEFPAPEYSYTLERDEWPVMEVP